MEGIARRFVGRPQHKYAPLNHPTQKRLAFDPSKTKKLLLLAMMITLGAFALMAFSSTGASSSGHGHGPGHKPLSCDTVSHGYECEPEISHHWGQYSPYFSVPSEIPNSVPPFCKVTFAQVLSRHGARDPTSSKTKAYNATIHKLHSNVNKFTGSYAFIGDYEYTLGADQLTGFGQQEMVNSGIDYYGRYEQLARKTLPFIRSSGEDRVVESAQNWTQGFHNARLADRHYRHHDTTYPYSIVVVPEGDGYNNTLNHGLCTDFENGPEIDKAAQKTWADIFVTPIQARLNEDMPGANLTQTDVIYIMDLCPFNTVASPTGKISPFCHLFTEKEWHQYSYYETLNKYYGYSYGNPLGPTQGVGFVNELIARLTNEPVEDQTTSNHTLDENKSTFPLGRKLYADFSHDNDMTAVYAALGLYNGTQPLSNTTVTEAEQAGGYSAAWTVPFAARVYIEKMQCWGQHEELVRVIMNDRVVPLQHCDGDKLGRCKISKFVDSLNFARGNGDWDQCFK